MNETFTTSCNKCGKDHSTSRQHVVEGVPSTCKLCLAKTNTRRPTTGETYVAAAYDGLFSKVRLEDVVSALDYSLRTVDDLRDALCDANTDLEKRAICKCIADILRGIADDLEGAKL